MEFNELKMLNREEVAELFGCHVDNVSMLTEVGCIKSIKIGKRYMYSYEAIKQFQDKYEGFDVSNRVKAFDAYREVNKVSGC